MDLNNMSGAMQAFYLAVIYGGIGGLMFFFYRYLVAAPEEEAGKIQAKIDAKKAKRANKKG